MHIMIIGGGKVGETLIEHLSEEGNDITLIDKNPQVVETLTNSYDIIAFEGTGTNYDTLQDANVATSDMFLSVTESDEINIISAFMAKQMGAGFAIARVRSPEYSEHLEFMIEKLGIDLVINPDQAAAIDIERILKFPQALDVEIFAGGRVQMVETRVEKDSLLDGKSLSQLPGLGLQILVCIVTRDGDVTIPRGDFVLQDGDEIYVTGSTKALYEYSRALGFSKERIQGVFIVGGGRITQYITKRLLRAGKRVKILEMDKDRAEELAVVFPEAVIIRGDGTNQELLDAEGLNTTMRFWL
jgi:trk system potassium uptake protein TrkA